MRNKKGICRFTFLIVLLLVAVNIVFTLSESITVKAASTTLVNVQSKETDMLQSNRYNFKLDTTSDIEINVYVPAQIGVTFTVKSQSGKIIGNPMYLTSYDGSWILDGRGWYTYKYIINQLEKGSYSIDYVFDQETKFDAKVVQVANKITLNSDKLFITKGFSKTVKVNNGSASKWSSKNPSIASVNSKGKITGKKNGKTTIIAHLKNGKTLKCKVTIKANEYVAKKITMANVGINEYLMKAYHATYQPNGNLLIKFKIANGTDKKMTEIPNLYISVVNQKNKRIASYSHSSFKVNVPAHSVKEYSVVINKNNMHSKKADLRNTNIEIIGERIEL